MRPPIRAGTVVLADVTAIRILYPDWRSMAAGLRDPGAWIERAGADTVVGTLAVTALWVVCVWLGLASLAIFAGALPGIAGVIARSFANAAVPAILRRAVAGALGVGILVAPAAALASPIPSPTSSTGSAGAALTSPLPAPSWPSASAGSAHPTGATTSGRPSNAEPAPRPPGGTAPPAPRDDHRQPPATNESVVVRPGDSLWVIAAARLGQPASEDQVAVAWPRWYEANRAEIGSNPNLIRPGQILHAPDAAEGSR
jgi:resuscitation-promoting factor RpfA